MNSYDVNDHLLQHSSALFFDEPRSLVGKDTWLEYRIYRDGADVNTFGDLGRNTFYGPNWETVDVALQKNWPLKFLGNAGNFQFKWAITLTFSITPTSASSDATSAHRGQGN